jgi:oxygen-independent coproporphyrinogen-3 oxidase
LILSGHDDRYAVEQLQMALFPEGTQGDAHSTLHRGTTWLTAKTVITMDGKTVTGCRRLKAVEETVRLRRQILQQSYYLAAVQLLPSVPAWGALSGVRPTKITSKHLLAGGTEGSADRMLKDVYYVTEERKFRWVCDELGGKK